MLSSMIALALLPVLVPARTYVESVNPGVLRALNATVKGRLHTAKPVSAPCYSTFNGTYVGRDESACTAVEAGYTSPTFRVANFGAYMVRCHPSEISDPLILIEFHDQLVQ
jgi:hypothetical protein